MSHAVRRRLQAVTTSRPEEAIRRLLSIACISTILLSGCADSTSNPEAWEGMSNDLRRSAKLRQQYIDVCIAAAVQNCGSDTYALRQISLRPGVKSSP
jgi:hypothetical protein